MLGRAHDEQPSLLHKLHFWNPHSVPPKHVISERLREWPHDAHREHILKTMSAGGAPSAVVEATKSRLLVSISDFDACGYFC